MEKPPLEGSFFTCTLGEAALFNANHPHPSPTVQRMLDYQASVNAKCAAVGFFLEMPQRRREGAPRYKIYSILP